MDQDVLQISSRREGDVTILRLSGELDSMNVGDLNNTFTSLLRENRRLFVLDLGDLEFIDSAGLGGLVSLWERSLEHGCFLALGAKSPRVRDVLTITGLNSVLRSYASMPEAIKGVREMMNAFPQKTADAAPSSAEAPGTAA